MSLASMLLKLGLSSEKIAELGGIARNPAAKGLGALEELAATKAYGRRPKVSTRMETNYDPKPIVPQIDDFMQNGSYDGRPKWETYVDDQVDNLGRPLIDGAGDKLDALAAFLRRQQGTARSHPLAYNAGAGAAGGGLLALLMGDDNEP